MTKQDKILYAQKCITTDWMCPEDSFNKPENVIFETKKHSSKLLHSVSMQR